MRLRPLPLCLLFAAGAAQAEDTSYVRQMAKDKTDLYLVVSGPETRRVAEAFLDRIKSSPDYKEDKGKTVEVVDLAAFATRTKADEKILQETVVLLVAANERPNEDDVARFGLALPKTLPYVATLSGRVVRPVNKSLSFRIAAVAPDAARVSRLLDEAVALRANRWDGLRLERSHVTHRITVHGSGTTAPNWSGYGGDDWTTVTQAGLADAPPSGDDDPEMENAYLIDRSQPVPTLPAEVVRLARSVAAGPATMFAVSGKDGKGRPLALLCAPSAPLLRGLAAANPSLDRLPGGGVSREAVDLRRTGKTSLFVGRGLSRDTANAVGDALVRNLRQVPSLDVRAGGEIDLGDLLGRSRDARRLRDDEGLRYAWVVSFSGLDKGTAYASHSDRTSPALPVPGPEPLDKSADERGPKAQKRAHDQWIVDHRAWDKAARDYDAAPLTWLAEVKEARHARLRVSLDLVDLQGDAKSVWSDARRGEATDSRVVSSRTVEVHGMRAIVPAPPAPNGTDDCPDKLVEDAGLAGGLDVLHQFSLDAWLSGDPASGSEQLVGSSGNAAPERAAFPPSKVLKATNGSITIDLGAKDGIEVGDRVVIGIEDEPSVVFRVVSVGETATCEPLDAKNRELAPKVRKGDKVERIVRANR